MNFDISRKRMVDSQLVNPQTSDRRPITDLRVIEAMLKMPRHLFVQEAMASQAYNDTALPIGEKQTISQPYMVALMTEMLELTGCETVLEIGTGSGYQAAILSKLAKRVCTVERIAPLAARARKLFDTLGLTNIAMKIDDGTVGWSSEAPFDAIIVTAGAPSVPEELVAQLTPGGRMVIPVGDRVNQELLLLVKQEDGSVVSQQRERCRFVNLIGKKGWQE